MGWMWILKGWDGILLVQDFNEIYVGCMTSRDWGVIPQECRLLMMQSWF